MKWRTRRLSADTTRPTVLYVHPSTELYGSDRMAVVTVQGLVENGVRVTVVLPSAGPLISHFEDAGARVLVRPALVLRKALLRPRRWPQLVWQTAASYLTAVRLIRRLKPDAVYVNTITQPTWMLGSWISRTPFIVHVREAENGASSITRHALMVSPLLARIVVCNSQATERFVRDSSAKRRVNTRVIYNGKDWSSYFSTSPAPIGENARLAIVGRLNPRKGQHVVIEAMRILHADGVRVSATFVGDVFPGYEWYEKELRASAMTAGVAEFCHFVGFSEDIATHLSNADIAVVPSLIEPFGTVAVEAMAAMRPTIASNTEGLAEIVDHRATGILFPPGDAAALAEAVKELTEDPEFALRLAKNGRNSVIARFNYDVYQDQIYSTVRETLSSRDF